jgi:CAAX prenyl protease-like protein
VGLLVFGAWITLDLPYVSFGQDPSFVPLDPSGRLDWFAVAIRCAGAALVVPLMEELFWRSLLMRWIDGANFLDQNPTGASWRAVVFSSIAFGFEHQLWFAGILAGLAYACLYRASGNLWSAITAHAVTNGALAVWVVASGRWEFW